MVAGYERVWDSSCPHVWDTWEANGKTWIIQDLLPEDDDRAVDILINHLVADEPLCIQSGLYEDPESVESSREVWKASLAKRTSLGCYTDVDGQQTLVALNCCLVVSKGEDHDVEIRGQPWRNVYGVIDYIEHKADAFEHLGVDKVLAALGLVVQREYRGANLGARLLNAREPLCRALGIKGTATVFTGPASQHLAAKCGFSTLLTSTWTDFADVGLDYPRVDNIVKYMVKKYQ